MVLNLAWSTAANKKPGQQELKAYASHLKRPIKVIDMDRRRLVKVSP